MESSQDVAARAGDMIDHLQLVDRWTDVEIDQPRLCEDQGRGCDLHRKWISSTTRGRPTSPRAVQRARERDIHILALAMRTFDCPRSCPTTRGAAYDITDYVLSLVHRRVVYISGPAGLYASRHRLHGFREAASDAA